jgi:hypothetical protein
MTHIFPLNTGWQATGGDASFGARIKLSSIPKPLHISQFTVRCGIGGSGKLSTEASRHSFLYWKMTLFPALTRFKPVEQHLVQLFIVHCAAGNRGSGGEKRKWNITVRFKKTRDEMRAETPFFYHYIHVAFRSIYLEATQIKIPPNSLQPGKKRLFWLIKCAFTVIVVVFRNSLEL